MTDTLAELNASLVGRYLVEKEVGQGGMATVYLARDVRHDRKVAIKVLHPELAAVLGPERFVTEMKVTANLQHPHILPLFDSGTARGQLFYVMPFVDGESLRDRLSREQQLPIDDAIRIATEVAGALDYAHRHGVVHRDIKPENILLHDGTALVADFGIALAVSNAGGTRLTQTGLSLGTPQYMSPEQATGDRNIDGRTDVYSLGCVLYEMLAGEPPFTGPNSQSIVARVLTETVRPLRGRRDSVSPATEAAVLKAVQKLPADRFATPQAFADALRTAGTVPFTAATPVPSVSRRPLIWPAISAVAVAAALWFGLHRSAASNELQLARQLTFDGNVTHAAISPDGNSLAYVTDDCFGQSYACNLTLRVRDVDGTQSIAIEKSWRAIDDVKWSPNGAMLAVHGSPDSSDEAIYLTDKLGGSLRPLHVRATAMAFTHDSRLLAVAMTSDQPTFARYDVASLARVDSMPLPRGWTIADMSYSPKGDRVAAFVDVSGFTRFGLALLSPRGAVLDSVSNNGARPSLRWTQDGGALLQFEFAPGIGDNLYRIPVDGHRLRADRRSIVLGQVPTGYQGVLDAATTGRAVMVVAQTSQELLLWRGPRTDPAWRSLTNRTGYFEPWSISPDGHFVAATTTDNLGDNIALFSLDSAGPIRQVSASRGEHEFPEISPDARHVAYLSWAELPGRLVVVSAGGGSERAVMPGTSQQFTWLSPDSLVVMHADTFDITDTTGNARRRVVIPGGPMASGRTHLVKDPAGPRLAYWSDVSSGLIVADLDRRTARAIAHHASPLVPAAWGRDGSIYAYEVEDAAEAGAGPQHRRVVRIPATGGAAVPVVDLPAGCVAVVVDTDAHHVVCDARRFKSDVWLADKAGRSGW